MAESLAIPPHPAPDPSSAARPATPAPPRAHGTCEVVATSAVSRYGSTATVLADGRVLLAGSAVHDAQGPYASVVEIFDPKAKTLTKVAHLLVGRAKHAAVRLADGRVLVAGGMSEEPKTSFSAATEIYDVTKDKWTRGGPIPTGAFNLGLAALPDGRAVLAGGDLMLKAAKLTTTAAFDPKTLRWSRLPDAPAWRTGDLVALDDHRFVFAGDTSLWSGGEAASGVDVFDATTSTWKTYPFPVANTSVTHAVALSSRVFVFSGTELTDTGFIERMTVTDRDFGSPRAIVPPAGRGDLVPITLEGELYAHREGSLHRYDEASSTWHEVATTKSDGCSTMTPLTGRRVLFAGRCNDDNAGAIELCELP